MRGGIGNFAGGLLGGSLKAELEMIEAGSDERGEFSFVERKTAGDQADIQTCLARGMNQLHDVGAGQRLAAGEIHLEHTVFRGFGKHTHPGLRWKLLFTFRQLQRIAAIGTVQRTPVG